MTMPRRSQRKRVKKNSTDSSDDCRVQHSQSSFEVEKCNKKRETLSEGKDVCCKCGKEDSPFNKGEEEDTWIDCDICGKW